MSDPPTSPLRLALVTGPSGAGRSSALRALEDIGFETIDNLPLRLLSALLDDPGPNRQVALGIDPRTRDFSTGTVLDELARMSNRPDVQTEVVYLDCATDVLVRRYSETRRRHPLAGEDRLEAGIARELDLLRPLRAHADVLIDTSALNIHELRAEIENWFGRPDHDRLRVSVQSFSYKRGLPRGVDMVLDCRFLANPHWVAELRPADGRDSEVQSFIAQDPRHAEAEARFQDLALWLLPAYAEEGKSHFSIAFGCTGGQHRSVALAESTAAHLAQAGWRVSIWHRELDRRQTGAQASGANR
ncbi:MAG: RNase adapter RapZ [Pseudomonadota bacterium]